MSADTETARERLTTRGAQPVPCVALAAKVTKVVQVACLAGGLLGGLLTACGDSGGTSPNNPNGSQVAQPDSGRGPGPPAAAPADGPPDLLRDITAEAGIDFVHTHGGRNRKYLFETMGSGVAVADFDGDDLPDLLFVQSGTLPLDEFDAADRKRAPHAAGETSRLYRNTGDGRFEDVTAGSGLGEALYGMGLAVGDVDADGDRDVYLAAYGQDRLYLNDGKGRFTEAAKGTPLADPRWTVGGAFLDVEGDGDLDLYTVGYLDMPVSSHRFCGPGPDQRTYCHVDQWDGLEDRLWINDGSGRFTDGSEAAGITGVRGKGLAVVGGDYDDDGDVDLFVANDSQANNLWRNDGNGHFTDVARASGTDLNGEGRSEACMGVDIGDLDGDADLDLFVVNFENETNTLYRNDGGGFFTDVSMASGAAAPSMPLLGFGTCFLDVDSDGDLDIYVANGHIMDNVAEVQQTSAYAQPDQLFFNDGRGRFQLAPAELSVAFRAPRVGRGLASGDLDGDGDEDLVVTNSQGAPYVLLNDLARGQRLVVELVGPDGRSDAEGARVVAHVGDRRLMREVRAGGSYLSHSDNALVFGLGDATQVDELEIRWPDGSRLETGPLPAGQRHQLGPGQGLIASTPLKAPSGSDGSR